ncbi:ABC transporter ATP-binding protein [Rugosimonospora acidiphila]|uniref:ABC transporter ATP-binding protein n=1 Tax=Rugosimonospora acidiphila TaxID=556531 RepID=A0ABP9SNC5_9ACTN
MTAPLPVAPPAEVRRAARRDIARERGTFVVMMLLNVLAAGVGLAGPWLLGVIVDTVKASPHAVLGTVDRLGATIVAVTIAHLVLSRYALYVGARFGERTAARVRERFLERSLALPARVAERSDLGDLLARGTTDINSVAGTLSSAAPTVLINGVQALLLIAAVLIIDPLLGVCGLGCLAVITAVLRWYLRRARPAYLALGAASSVVAEVLSTTAGGARTIEALGLQRLRAEATERAIAASRGAQLHALSLRTVLYPTLDISYTLPLVGVLILGAVLYAHGLTTLGTVIAAALYLRQLASPIDNIMIWIEQLQIAGASYARVEGLATVPTEQPHSTAEPTGDRIEVTGAHYSYGHGDVLRGIDLSVRAGERLAIVGPSGAGKSTLGRLLAGVDGPHTGTVTVGRVPIGHLAPDRLRRQVVLVTQEHHVFHDSLRDNLRLAHPGATDAQLRAALATVGARWADELPDGLDTVIGGAHQLGGAEAQQVALARVILADPHTVILDEATALLDATTARGTERALAAVLDGRTVIAIAHRLQTAHDADRVVVMDAGLITELGRHEDLIALGGTYARLWRSWHDGGR